MTKHEKSLKELNAMGIRFIWIFTLAFLGNLLMAIFYGYRERNLYNTVLQIIHTMMVIYVVLKSMPTFVIIRKTNILLNKIIKQEQDGI